MIAANLAIPEGTLDRPLDPAVAYHRDWHERYVIAFDIETTGVDVETSRIVTWSAAVVWAREDHDPLTVQQVVIPDGYDIPEGAARVHGWTAERIADHDEAVHMRTALTSITGMMALAEGLRIPIVIYNAPYDLGITIREYLRLGMPVPRALAAGAILDPLVLDKAIDRFRRGNRKLATVAEHYGIPLDGAHDATADAVAAGQLALHISRLIPTTHLGELQAFQRQEKEAQSESLQGYLRRTKNDESIVVDYRWPYAPIENLVPDAHGRMPSPPINPAPPQVR